MASCKKISEKILEYLEGSLLQKQKEELERHIVECPDCRKLLILTKETSQIVQSHFFNKAEKIEIPTLLWGKILEKTRKTKRELVFQTWIKVVAGVCAMIALLLTGTFAPVFGVEGNLINLITSSIINSEASSFEDMYTDDFTGQFRKAATEAEISKVTNLTQQDIWDLKQQGLKLPEIPIIAFIAKNSSMQFDDLIALRTQKGWGWGRIANTAGISVFSARLQIVAPLAVVKEKVRKVDEIEVDRDLATIDHQVVLSGIKTTIPITQDTKLNDQFGKPVTLNEIAELGFARIRLRLNNGKPIALTVIAQYPPQKVAAFGQLSMLANGGIIISTPEGEAVIIPGETSVIGQLVQGAKVFVQGFRARGRFIARIVRVLNIQQEVQTQQLKTDGNTKNNNQASDRKTIADNSNTSDQAPEQDVKKPSPEDLHGIDNQEKQPLKPILSGFNNGVMVTNIGSFRVSNQTRVTVETGIGKMELLREAIGRFPVGTEIKVVLKDNIAIEIEFPRKAITESKGFLLGRGTERGKVSICTKGFVKIELFIVPGSLIESNERLMPGSMCFAISVGQSILYMKLQEPQKPCQGKVVEIDDNYLSIQDTSQKHTFKIISHSVFMAPSTTKNEQGSGANPGGGRQGQGNAIEREPFLISISKNDIKLGDAVRIVWAQFDNQRIALEILRIGRKQGENKTNTSKIYKVSTFADVEGTDQKEIKFRDNSDIVIIVSQSKTAIFLSIGPGAVKKGTIFDIKSGSKIKFVLYANSDIAKEVTIIP